MMPLSLGCGQAEDSSDSRSKLDDTLLGRWCTSWVFSAGRDKTLKLRTRAHKVTDHVGHSRHGVEHLRKLATVVGWVSKASESVVALPLLALHSAFIVSSCPLVTMYAIVLGCLYLAFSCSHFVRSRLRLPRVHRSRIVRTAGT